MTKSDTDLDELKTLQREAAQLRAERRRSGSSAKSAAPQQSATEPTEASVPSAEDRVDETQTPSRKRTETLQSDRKKSRATVRKASAAADQSETGKPPQGSDDKEAMTQAEAVIQDLAVQIGSLVNEMEAAAKERPAVALLAAFTIGIVIGQLFSRTKG